MKNLKVHIQIFYYEFHPAKAFVTQLLFDEYQTIDITDEQMAHLQKQKGYYNDDDELKERLSLLAKPYMDYLHSPEMLGDEAVIKAFVMPVFNEEDADTTPDKGTYWVEDGILLYRSDKGIDDGLVSIISCLDKTKTVVTCPSVTIVEAGAFRDCRYLREVHLPNAAVIRESAFEGCTSLQSLELCDELSLIQERTFAGCVMLREFRIPQDVVGIFDEAFLKCFNLTRLVFPDGTVITPDDAPDADDVPIVWKNFPERIPINDDVFAFTPLDFLGDNPCYDDDDDDFDDGTDDDDDDDNNELWEGLRKMRDAAFRKFSYKKIYEQIPVMLADGKVEEARGWLKEKAEDTYEVTTDGYNIFVARIPSATTPSGLVITHLALAVKDGEAAYYTVEEDEGSYYLDRIHTDCHTTLGIQWGAPPTTQQVAERIGELKRM